LDLGFVLNLDTGYLIGVGVSNESLTALLGQSLIKSGAAPTMHEDFKSLFTLQIP